MALKLEKLSDSVWALMDGSTLLAEVADGVINVRGTFKMGTDLVSPSASELAAINGMTAVASEIDVASVKSVQTLTDDGAITLKNGIVRFNKAGAIAATLAAPTAGTDDHKELTIVSLQAQANTVTATNGFGNGGGGENVATFSGAIGDALSLKAYGGFWYIVGYHQVVID